MTAQEQAEAIEKKIVPLLAELGLEAFMVAGYASDGEGKIHKVTFAYTGQNPAYSDGLRGMVIMAARWGQGEL
jgi:hypothetical protein